VPVTDGHPTVTARCTQRAVARTAMDEYQFTAEALQLDVLPDSFTKDQVLGAVRQALQRGQDARSDLDESRIASLRKALTEIEQVSKEPGVALLAKRALQVDDD